MKKHNALFLAVAASFVLCSCAPGAESESSAPRPSPPAASAPQEKTDPDSELQQKGSERLTELGYEVVRTDSSKAKLEFAVTLSGFSDQDLSVCPEDWEEIRDSVLEASEIISEIISSSDSRNIVIYLQDADGNNYLTLLNGKQSYSAFADPSSGGYNPPTITLEEFNAIKTGMTFQEVYDIIGGPGEVISEVDLGIGEEYQTVIRQWSGEGSIGANANVTFQGGRVSVKAQFGLE